MFVPDPAPLEIEVLVIPESTLISVAAVIEPMRAANRVLGRRQFDWVITSPDGAPAPTHSGIPVPAARPFDRVHSAHELNVAPQPRDLLRDVGTIGKQGDFLAKLFLRQA